MMKKIRNRVFGNWKSSLLGSLLIIICLVLIFIGKATFLEVNLLILIGLGLLGVKDPQNINLRVVLLIFGSTLILSSCTPQKRLNRLLKHHPELLQKDTVYYRDTLIIPATKYDTVFKTNFDTIHINSNRYNIELIRHDSLIYLTHTTPGDTIIKNIPIPIERIKYIQEPKKTNYWFWVALGAILFIVFIIVINILSFIKH